MKSTVPPVGQVFGRLTVLGLGQKKYYWLCQCSCGNTTETSAHRITTGSVKSCGCIRREVKQNLAGQKFGKLTVLFHLKERPIFCVCQCDCGSKPKKVHNKLLLSGDSQSCGCYRLEQATKANTTHGMTKKSVYRIWTSMMARCFNSGNSAYHDYGARGITVCERWLKFENFYADMGERPEGKTLDRIDNDKSYSPNNCRWASVKEQSRNKRSNVWISFNGKRQVMTDWARETGIPPATLKYRLDSGWSIEKALTTKGRKKEA
jgi:hypothetical protein